ncbi:unnamed protein product, partial [Mycena citricolor]
TYTGRESNPCRLLGQLDCSMEGKHDTVSPPVCVSGIDRDQYNPTKITETTLNRPALSSLPPDNFAVT